MEIRVFDLDGKLNRKLDQWGEGDECFISFQTPQVPRAGDTIACHELIRQVEEVRWIFSAKNEFRYAAVYVQDQE